MPTRRQFLATTAATATASAVTAADPPRPWVGLQSYPWRTFRKRAGLPDAEAEVVANLADAGKCGADGFEGVAATPDAMKTLAAAAKAAGLAMRSVYIPCNFHDPMAARVQVQQAFATAREAKKHGVTIIVTNPAPISWVAPLVDKTDQQLRMQAELLGRVGRALAAQGQTLAYHTHDMEMRHSAREFHHMLLHTDPAHLGFCLDAHWVYRGSGDSELALFDVVKLYGKRVVELHLRQSERGVWTEAFGRGDIDYAKLAVELAALKVKPLLVLEQAVEAKTPNTLDAVTAHSRGVAAVREVFGAVIG